MASLPAGGVDNILLCTDSYKVNTHIKSSTICLIVHECLQNNLDLKKVINRAETVGKQALHFHPPSKFPNNFLTTLKISQVSQ